MVKSSLLKTYVVSLAIGILLGSAGLSFVGFGRAPDCIRPDDPLAQLGEATVSPDGRWVVMYAWRGDQRDPEANGSLLFDLETRDVHALHGVVPMPGAWDAAGNLRVLSRGLGDMRTIDPETRIVLATATEQSDVRTAMAWPWSPAWCGVERRTGADGAAETGIHWASEDLRVAFPAGPGYATRVGALEGVAFHSRAHEGSTRIERHDLRSGASIVLIQGLTGAPTTFEPSPDGAALIVVEGETCRVIDAHSGAALVEPWTAAWARWAVRGDARLVFSERAGEVELRHLDTDEVVALGRDTRAAAWRLTLLPDGRLLIQKPDRLDLHDPRGRFLRTLFPRGVDVDA